MTVLIQRAPRLRDQVYEAVRQMLRDGSFSDAPLTEEALAERLQVSRTPIREALFQLCREGVLEDAGRGYRTPTLTGDDVREIMQLRRLIEPAIARAIVKREDEQLIAALREAVATEARTSKDKNAAAFIAANARFRELFLSGAENRRMTQMMGTIDDQVARLRQQTLGPIENRQQALAAHRKFIDALGKSDADGAEKATHQLLDAAGAYYERIWRGAVSERA
jgi:DNA-binding GntR family transcriptional regulator